MSNQDIRWQQRFQNYQKALALLENAVELFHKKGLSELEAQGLIKRFEFTHELAWNVIKDYLEYQGNSEITGSRDATREAFRMGLIEEGDGWMEMIRSRNQTSHTYNEAIADEMEGKIINTYFDLFCRFKDKMKTLIQQ